MDTFIIILFEYLFASIGAFYFIVLKDGFRGLSFGKISEVSKENWGKCFCLGLITWALILAIPIYLSRK